MLRWLKELLRNVFGDSIASALGGAGLSLVTAAVMIPLVTTALNTAASSIGGITGDVLNVILLFGFGEAISIIGSAMLTRMVIGSGRVGVKRASA